MDAANILKRFLLLLLFPYVAFGQGVILPPQQALKVVNGITSPVANATITVCAANTSGIPCSPVLPSALFKDAALTQPLTNPFTSDANGNYVFAIAPGNYTVTVTGLGFAGYSYQTTAPVASGANNTFSSTNTFGGATNLNGGGALTGTFSGGPATFSGSNNFTGNVSVKQIENIVKVDSANSQGWAGADACAWIGSAVNALPISGGGTVDARGVQGSITCASNNFLSGLTVRPAKILLGAITISPTTGFLIDAVGWNDLQIIGQEGGTVINLPANQSAVIMCGSGANSSCAGATSPLLRVHISGLTINGVATCSQTFCGALGVGIQLISCQLCEVDHIRGGGTAQPFIYFSSDSVSQFATKNHVHHNWITNTWSSNILFTQFSQGAMIDHNFIYNTHRNAIDVNGTSTTIQDNIINTVTQSSADTSDLRGINIFEGGGSIVNTDNLIANNWITGTDQEGIRVESDDSGEGNRTKVIGNTVYKCGLGAGTGTTPAGGIAFTSVNGNSNVEVVGNQVDATGKSGSTTGGVGIEVDNMTGAMISGNVVTNSQTTGMQFNTSTNYVVSGNIVKGSRLAASGTFGDYLFNGSALNDVIIGNIGDDNGSFALSFTQSSGTMINTLLGNGWTLSQITKSGTVSIGDNSINQGSNTSTTCPTAATVGSTCTFTVTWAIPFVDATYNGFSCQPTGAITGEPVWSVTSQVAASLTVTVSAATAAAANFGGFQCAAVGIH